MNESYDSEYFRDRHFIQLVSRTEGAQKRTYDRKQEYFDGLPPGVVEPIWRAEEEILLHDHRNSNYDTDGYAYQARGANQQERLVKV